MNKAAVMQGMAFGGGSEIDFIGCEGIDLNSFVHSQWHKHTKAA